jgi:recombinational DNA repair ATPase RecF
MSNQPTIIVSLVAENIKRLRAVRVDPKSRVVRIGGRNGQGKTSLLDCIAMALGGAGAAPSKPIRDGAARGQIVLETNDLIVTRKFTAGGTSLEVTNKEGAKFRGRRACWTS